MATHSATHKDTDNDNETHAERTERERLSATESQRRSSLQSPKLRPVDTFEALEKHQKEVEEDEKSRREAFEESAVGKRIKQRQEKATKDGERSEPKEQLSEEDAKKRAREALPPAVKEDGTIDLPVGAALPPAVPEPRHPNAGAWETPLAEPPSEESAQPQAKSKHAHAA